MSTPDFAFIDGFDHYWPAIETAAASSFDLTTSGSPIAAEYSVLNSPAWCATFAALSGTGCCLGVNAGSGSSYLIKKGLSANYARSIGGAQVKWATMSGSASSDYFGIVAFFDGATAQVYISINPSGIIRVTRGVPSSGTLLGSSTETISVNSVNEIEWDVTIHGSAGIVKIWINGVLSSINLSGVNTSASGVAQFNAFALTGGASVSSSTTGYYDHMYFYCWTTAGSSDTPLLTNPVIETTLETADDSVQFTATAGILGNVAYTCATNSAPGANQLALRTFTPGVNCTLNSIGILPEATSATAKFKAVLYADSSGSPGTLVATGTEVVGTTSGSRLALPFASGQSLTSGTAYWIGYITDTSVVVRQYDTTTTPGQTKANTYTSGAPNPAGTMTTGKPSYLIWGNLTGMSANWYQTGQSYAYSGRYNASSTVSNQDTFTFASLSSTPASIYLVTLRGAMTKSDGGARTLDLVMKSGASTSLGSLSNISPPLSLSYQSSNYWVDPNTGLAWTATGLNSAKSGYKIDS
jgi:hypothetical protein